LKSLFSTQIAINISDSLFSNNQVGFQQLVEEVSVKNETRD